MAQTTQQAKARSRRAAVYRLFDPNGVLLYIGSSYDPDKRCESHRRKPWWREVARRTEEWHDGRGKAYDAETAAIWREKPKYNVASTAAYVARRSAEARAQAPLYRQRAKASDLRQSARFAARPSFLSRWRPGEPAGPVLDELGEIDRAYARAERDPSWVPQRYATRAEEAATAMVSALRGMNWPERRQAYGRLHRRLAEDLASEGATDEEIAVVMAVATRLVGERVDLLAEERV